MKTRTLHRLYYIIGGILLPLLSMSQARELSIVEKCIEKRKQFDYLEYEIEMDYKMYHWDKSFSNLAKVEIVRQPEDSLFSGLFSIDMDSVWYGYDGSRLLKGNKPESILTIGDPTVYPGLFVKSTWVDFLLDYGFIKLTPGPIIYITDPSINKTYTDTVIAGWPCLGIMFDLPDNGDFYNQRFFVAIDTIEYIVRSRMLSSFFQENKQYNNWVYKNVKYGNDQRIERLDETYISNFHRIDYFSSDTTFRELSKQYDYSRLEGKFYNKDEVFRLKDIHSKIIILDFWYTSCFPCIKGIPSVNRLARDYKDKGVRVYGINMIDDELSSLARLEKFFKNNLMEYQPIMVDPAKADEIGIRAYPTLIVLDKDYQIIYMEDGFTEDLYEKVAKVIEANL